MKERAGIGRRADKREKPARFPALNMGAREGLAMADENDFTDHLHVVRPSRVEVTPPALAERTTDEEEENARLDKLEEEQRKNILEQIGRESDLLFKDLVWNTRHALALIAFKDVRRITDDSWHGLHPRAPAPVETNPRKVLHDWLLEPRITASINGEEKSPRFWDSVEYYELLRKYPNACFRRDDLLKLVLPPTEAPGSSPKTSSRRNPRRPAAERERVKKAIIADVEQGHDPTTFAVAAAGKNYKTSEDTFIKARDELEDGGELAAARERHRVKASRSE